jgi:HK97 family phage major capsid protein
MKLSDKLKAKRAELKKQMRALVEKAEAESRDFTPEERAAFDSHKAAVASLDTRITDVTTTEEEERGADGQVIAGDRREAEGEVRALLPNQRMVDLLPPENRNLSTVRWLRGTMLGDWDGAEAEKRATLVEGTGSLGGLLVPPAPISATIIDIVRNRSAFVPAGALTIPMDNPEMTLVRVLTTPTPGWRKEGAALPTSDMTFGPIKVSAKTLGVMVEMTVELVEDAPTVEQVVNNAIGQALALELDRVAFFGNGTDEPLGLDGQADINTVSMGANGATPTDYDPFIDAIAAVETLNGSPSAAVYSPRTANTLRKLKTGLSGDKTTLVPPAEFTALRRIVSNQIGNAYTQGSATNTSKAFVGDYSQAAVALRSGVQLEATRTGGTDTFSKMKVLVRAYLRADVVFFRPSFFTRIVGIKP